ncbi:uncharacterized protein LOC132925028 [Rhopalosiphum padi]|uniref:uncharacterized protein LOC132925028 n=1 Tax=Rhopalosiphum padi TaxID=40932 RepID=UPI00298DEBF0|nr:uncharacterized protein LOC132925028 [Rhopalosiphum padi]
MIRCLQINLQRSSIPQSLLQQTSAATGAQILIVSEQNWNPTHDDRWVASTDGTCAVALTATADFIPDSNGAGRGFAWIQSRGIRIYSCYISRKDTDANFANFLGEVEQSVRSVDLHCSVIIGGDFNAWSQEWGSARNDARGDQLADLAASLDLLVGNVGTKPTYRRINAESVIDVTFHRCRPCLALTHWRVMDEVESASDHRYIQFWLERLRRTPNQDDPPERLRGWAYRQLNLDALTSHLAIAPLPATDENTPTDQVADQYISYLTSACDACMPPRAPPPRGRRQVHWWNQEIATLRDEYGRLRRSYHRAARRRESHEQLDVHRIAYKAKRKLLRQAIRSSQAKCWSDLCRSVDSDPWGLPYKVVTKRTGRRRPGIEARGMELEIADHLFPNPPATDWALEPYPPETAGDETVEDFTLAELAQACKRLVLLE